MSFIQSFFMSVAAFFGYGGEAPVEPVVVESVVEEQAEVMVATTESAGTPETATEPEAESIESVEDAMVGSAKPVSTAPASTVTTALVAGGCFWCVESDLEKIPGVISAVSGYAGGSSANPTYQDYGSGGHREVVEVTYDSSLVSFEDILIITMKTTDPTDDDGTFGDRGDKYSAAFYFETPAEQAIIENLIAEVDANGPYEAPLAIDVEPRATFWPAEDFHQDYYKGGLSSVKYKYYRNASGRDDFIDQYWSDPHSPDLPWRTTTPITQTNETVSMNFWDNYVKPSKEELKETLDPIVFKVTQEDGTERAGTSPLDKIWDDGIYVDILSGEPLYSSRDKFDSGTGWPSFVQPITPDALTEHEDRKLFVTRTETRSRIADNHIGHVFTDGPADRGGLRYCMNGAALKFIPKAEMEAAGYGEYLQYI